MKLLFAQTFAAALLLTPALAPAQQAYVNLDCDPQRNAEGPVPFSAPLGASSRLAAAWANGWRPW